MCCEFKQRSQLKRGSDLKSETRERELLRPTLILKVLLNPIQNKIIKKEHL